MKKMRIGILVLILQVHSNILSTDVGNSLSQKAQSIFSQCFGVLQSIFSSPKSKNERLYAQIRAGFMQNIAHINDRSLIEAAMQDSDPSDVEVMNQLRERSDVLAKEDDFFDFMNDDISQEEREIRDTLGYIDRCIHFAKKDSARIRIASRRGLIDQLVYYAQLDACLHEKKQVMAQHICALQNETEQTKYDAQFKEKLGALKKLTSIQKKDVEKRLFDFEYSYIGYSLLECSPSKLEKMFDRFDDQDIAINELHQQRYTSEWQKSQQAMEKFELPPQ